MNLATKGRTIRGYCLIACAPMKPSVAKLMVESTQSVLWDKSVPPNIRDETLATMLTIELWISVFFHSVRSVDDCQCILRIGVSGVMRLTYHLWLEDGPRRPPGFQTVRAPSPCLEIFSIN